MSTPNPLGIWGKPLVIREQTSQEIEQQKLAEAQRKANEKAQALNYEAQQLANKVENCIKTRNGGKSGNYIGDEQYEVTGEYRQEVITLGFQKWCAMYPNQVNSLNLHMLGPSPKYTGGRNGQRQANFLRFINPPKSYKFNIHINEG
jgi:hypothetical protein